MMRALVLGVAVLALAACDGGDPVDPVAQSGEALDPSLVTLKTDGLNAGPEAFYFAAGQSEVVASLGRALGKPDDSGSMPECGAGPMEFASFPGGLTVNFQNGALVGWNLGAGDANITFNDDIGIGAARSNVEMMPGFAMVEDSTLGEEFAFDDGLSGFFEQGEVSMLYAGTQCFFR